MAGSLLYMHDLQTDKLFYCCNVCHYIGAAWKVELPLGIAVCDAGLMRSTCWWEVDLYVVVA